MKIIIFILTIICLTFSASEASWYVVDANNKVVVKCEYQPDSKDLESRKEIAVFSEEDISLEEAEYNNGKIIRHIKTPAEIMEENKRKEEAAERILIEEKLKAMAIEKLKSEGVILKTQDKNECAKKAL